jgi:hypothetical protein
MHCCKPGNTQQSKQHMLQVLIIWITVLVQWMFTHLTMTNVRAYSLYTTERPEPLSDNARVCATRCRRHSLLLVNTTLLTISVVYSMLQLYAARLFSLYRKFNKIIACPSYYHSQLSSNQNNSSTIEPDSIKCLHIISLLLFNYSIVFRTRFELHDSIEHRKNVKTIALKKWTLQKILLKNQHYCNTLSTN